jgi:hypothetical protein
MRFLFRDRSDLLLIRSPGGVSGPPTGPNWRYEGQTFGIAVSDYDDDGLLDLYVNHHTLGPDELISAFATEEATHRFLNDGRKDEPGFDQHGPVFFDIDQDGDLDLVETRGGGKDTVTDPSLKEYWNRVYLNDGGVLSERNTVEDFGIERGPGRDRAITPINLDGRIGLFAGALPKDDGTWASQLFRRGGDGEYRDWDVLRAELQGAAFGIGAHLDGNGFADVVTATNTGVSVDVDVLSPSKHRLVVHEFGRRLAVEDLQVTDFDGDLKPEILVAFDGAPMRLLELKGDGTLADISSEARLPAGLTEVASVTTGDFDNDGDIDIVALLLGPGAEIVSLVNRGDGSFARKPSFTVEDLGGSAEAIVSGDFDNDGSLDLLVSTGRGRPDIDGGYALLEGRAGDNNWLTVSLESATGERNGLGARVIVRTGDGERQVLEQDSGNHYFVQDSPRLHFGLGDDEIDRVEVIWADGTRQVIDDVEVNQYITIEEEAGRAGDVIL